MLKQIRLTNYRQHEDRTVTFGPGINAIRAANGMGKTKLLESVTYVLFGARALSESLEDVVTRGVAVGKMKAEVDLSHMGADYTFVRGKSGAEVRANGRVLVTGQNEVTKFAEQLFGANADMAGKLMFAKQKQLGGALTGGATKAAEMIEFLADFDLFDRIIGLIQTKLPNGSTSPVEARIDLLRRQAAELVETDLQPLESAQRAAEAVLAAAKTEMETLKVAFGALDVSLADQILADQKRLVEQIGARTTKLADLEAKLALPLPVAPAAEALQALRSKINEQKNLTVAAVAHKKLVDARLGGMWDNDLASLESEIARVTDLETATGGKKSSLLAELQATEKANTSAAHKFSMAKSGLASRLITETTCALCQKDLADVPEVVTINSNLKEQISALVQAEEKRRAGAGAELSRQQLEIDAIGKDQQDLQDYLAALQGVLAANQKAEMLFIGAGEWVKLDRSVVPAKWEWIGPTAAPQDFAGDLATLEQADRVATAAAAQRIEQEARATELEQLQKSDQEQLDGLQVVEAADTLVQAAQLRPKIDAASTAREDAADKVHLSTSALTTAKMANEMAVTAQTAGKEQLALAETELVDSQANNALIKKIRAARPQVIDQLWALALSATSRYGSQMRGEQWVVSRADGEFKVNAFPAAGLSGAEEDLLGLSIRVALTKLFLPNTPFMILDEVAAACDAQREAAMLGLLSTLDFDQIILVTHSDLCEAYVDTIINL